MLDRNKPRFLDSEYFKKLLRKDQDHWDDRTMERRFFLASLFSYGGAVMTSKLFVAPLDRLKVHRQVHGVGLKDSIENFGRLRAWYRGSATHLTAIACATACRTNYHSKFQMYLAVARHETGKWDINAYSRRVAANYLAGICAIALIHPLDVAYTCLAADTQHRYKGVTGVFRQQVQERGFLRGVYRGLPLCLGTALPFTMIAVGAHDLLSHMVLERTRRRDWHVDELEPDLAAVSSKALVLYPWNLVIGVTSGLLAQAGTYPLDTLRRRYMTFTHSRPTVTECFKALRAEGPRACYAGFGVNCMKAIPELTMVCIAYYTIHNYLPH